MWTLWPPSGMTAPLLPKPSALSFTAGLHVIQLQAAHLPWLFPLGPSKSVIMSQVPSHPSKNLRVDSGSVQDLHGRKMLPRVEGVHSKVVSSPW